MRLILIILLLPIFVFSQDTISDNSGRYLRQSGQWLAIGGAIGGVGVVKLLVGDVLNYEVMESMGVALTLSSLPFLIIGVNKIYQSGSEMEQRRKINQLE